MTSIEKLKEKYLNSLTDNIEGSEEVLVLIKELKDCIELLRVVDEPNMNALFNYEATDNFEKFLDVVESQINSAKNGNRNYKYIYACQVCGCKLEKGEPFDYTGTCANCVD